MKFYVRKSAFFCAPSAADPGLRENLAATASLARRTPIQARPTRIQ